MPRCQRVVERQARRVVAIHTEAASRTLRLAADAFVLATGIVVDDAIVVIENIERHMREFGKSAKVWDTKKVVIIPDHYIFTADSLSNRNVDILREFDEARFDSPQAFLAQLSPIPPRLYSIASSLAAHPNEVHLCVAIVRYETHAKRGAWARGLPDSAWSA